MSSALPRVLIMLAVPIVAFVGGAWVMRVASDRAYVSERLERHAEPRDRKPLNQRIRYDEEDVRRHWDALDARGLAAERRFLLLDLGFPLVYGGALVASLIIGARLAGTTSTLPWFVGVVAITMVSDWTENVIHLTQLQRYATGGGDALSAAAIRTASLATLVKMVLFTGASMTIVSLAFRALWHASRR